MVSGVGLGCLVDRSSIGDFLMAWGQIAAAVGSAAAKAATPAPAVSSAQGGGNGAYFGGNGLTINKTNTSIWVWVLLIVGSILLFLVAL